MSNTANSNADIGNNLSGNPNLTSASKQPGSQGSPEKFDILAKQNQLQRKEMNKIIQSQVLQPNSSNNGVSQYQQIGKNALSPFAQQYFMQSLMQPQSYSGTQEMSSIAAVGNAFIQSSVLGGSQVANLGNRRLMMNASIQQTLLYPTNAAQSVERKHVNNTYSQAISKMVSQPSNNLSQLLSMHNTSTQERKRLIEGAKQSMNNHGGGGGVLEMIQKSKVTDAFQQHHCDTFNSSPQKGEGLLNTETGKVEDLQALKQQIMGGVNIRKQNKRDNGINQKLGLPTQQQVAAFNNNNNAGSQYQKSNTLLPFISNGSYASQNSSPLKPHPPTMVNQSQYLADQDLSPQQIPHKSHSVASKAIGNNGGGTQQAGILERDEMQNLIRVSGIQQMSEPRSSQFFKKNNPLAGGVSTSVYGESDNLNQSHFTHSTTGGLTTQPPTSSMNPSDYQNYGGGSFCNPQYQQQLQPPMSNGSEGRSHGQPQVAQKMNPYSVNYQYLNSCFQVQQQSLQQKQQQLSSEFSAFQGLGAPQLLNQNPNQRQSKIFRIKNTQQQSNGTLNQDSKNLRRNSLHSHSNIEVGEDVDIHLDNSDFKNNQGFYISPHLDQQSSEPKSAHAVNRHSNGSTLRRRDAASHLGSKQNLPASDSHINQILDLINVQHVVHAGLGGGNLAPPVNCFPITTTVSHNYQGVFLGGDLSQNVYANSGQVQKTPQHQKKKKRSMGDAFTPDAAADETVNHLQKSSEFNRDSQFSKYTNQEIARENGKSMPSYMNLQRQATGALNPGIRHQETREHVKLGHDYDSRTPDNHGGTLLNAISLSNQKRDTVLSSAEKQQHTIDCAEIIKGHFQDRHNSLIRNQAVSGKKKKLANFQNIPMQISQLQQQQSEMLLSVLTTHEQRKKKQGLKNPAGGMVGGGHPSVLHNNPKRHHLLPQDHTQAFLKVSNGVNADQMQIQTKKPSQVDNPLYYQVLPNNNSSSNTEVLQIEGQGKQLPIRHPQPNHASKDQQLQSQFFSHIGNKDQSFFESLKQPKQMNSPQPIINDLYKVKSRREPGPPGNIIKNQCNIILAMISNNSSSTPTPEAQAQQSIVENMASGLNAEVLLSQLSEIVTKCQDLLRESTSPLAKRQLQRVQAMPFQVSTIATSPRRNQDGNSTTTISEMIERKESPLKIIKQVLESRLIDLTNQTVMMQNERRTQDTIKIYEDLLNEITVALEQLKNNPDSNQISPLILPESQSDKANTINEMSRISPPNFIKMSGLTPGLSPRIFKSNKFSTVKKNPSKSSPFSILPSLANAQKPKIQIYHQPFTHLNDHPINQAITKINYIIKLIFKSSKDPQFNQSSNQTSQHQLEEAKLSEIYRMSRVLNIPIPKRFESKTQLREYIQSKEFLVALKSKINIILYNAINETNGFTQSDINYYQGISNQQAPQVPNGEQQQINQYQVSQKFFVGRGNNNALVRSVLKQRSWWVQYIPPNGVPIVEDDMVHEVSFIWTQWKRQKIIDYLTEPEKFPSSNATEVNQSVQKEPGQIGKPPAPGPRLRIYNKMEQNKQLTNKKGVFINMREYYKKIGQDPFEVLPLTFLIKSGEVSSGEFRRFEDHFAEISQVNKQREALRSEALAQRYKELEGMKKDLKKRPHIPSIKKIVTIQPQSKSPTKKKQDIYSDYYDEADDDEGDGGNGEQQTDFDQDEIVKDIKRRYKTPKNVWIVKPGENTNRGNGINVASSIAEIKSLVSSSGYSGPEAGGVGKDEQKTFIVQKYIDNPLLIHNRKFDFRCYGLMTSVNGHLKGYFYEDAYIRTSCKEFDISNLDNKYIHLTNDAVQKNSADYGKYENGNKMSLLDFQRYLKHLGNTTINPTGDSFYENIDVFRDLMPQIRKLVSDSYRAVYGKIDPGRLRNTFELFGYDFMLDDDFKLNLIEVNTNPCLEISCPLLARIIPEVLDNVFRVVLDPIFHQPESGHNRKYAINEIPQELKFTLVFDEDIDKHELLKLQSKNTVPSSIQGMGDKNPIVEEMIESDKESELDDGASDEEENNDNCVDKLNNLVVGSDINKPSVISPNSSTGKK